ncbi:SIR2 family protein [Georgenia sp. EYE_87]|uniref:SIR2 family protein n=1 Tax=Georgenia sp. EYE_87 TaxID=2853448 RepID=UPI002004ACB4|nr:SIR2 family protein [Georgenia sp. EYE_87]MCK6210832.1 SIR2 family protein [Georgenia sp. EYE_87]
MSDDDVAVLVGNGLSIAFNPALSLREITQEVLDRFEDEDENGSDVVVAMQEIAERALPGGATADHDFEVLVGAFGAERTTLSHLERLATLVKPTDQDLLEAIGVVAEFAEAIRDRGLSHVLEVIFERSQAERHRSRNLIAFTQSLTQDFTGRVTIGNLNYDTLLLSALLDVCQRELADLGHGYRTVKVTSSEDDETTDVPALRESANDFPSNRRVRLLHLHGSLTYWANRSTKVYAKLSTEFLREHDQWVAVRENRTNVRPVVVLANQRDKSEHVSEFPFSVAYEMFAEGLHNSNNWLIVGYSFRDVCVNDMLRLEFSERTANDKPDVLVVTFGDQPTRKEIERALGWGVEDGSSAHWLAINREGANGIQATEDWRNFVTNSTST